MFFKRPTFEEVAQQVLRSKKTRAKKTRRNAEWQIARLVRYFGKFRVHRVSEDDWNEYLVREHERRARKFYDDRKYMNMIIRHARKRGWREDVLELKIPDLPWDVGRELSQLELKRLRAAAREREGEGGRSRELAFQIDIAWKMGLRLGEMLRLRWDQFNWERGTIRLRAGDVKTRRGREVAVNPDLMPQFAEIMRRSRALFVFPNRRDTGPQGSNKTAWRRCRREAGVTCRWHDLRHTCATRMLRAGAPRHVVKAYLGMSERVLDRIYTHLNLDDLKNAALLMTDQVNLPSAMKDGQSFHSLAPGLLQRAAVARSPGKNGSCRLDCRTP